MTFDLGDIGPDEFNSWWTVPPYEILWQTWQTNAIIGKDKAMADTEGEILTLNEVAVFLKAGKRTVYRLAASGEIPAFKLGGTWRFRRSELNQWIAASIHTKKKPDER
jgi:excisionase family DNA binding protein